jgi:CPA1 family monovalent cation:H+ antiporter
VIFVTLVIQGLTLPRLIRFLNVSENRNGKQEESEIRRKLADAALHHINQASQLEEFPEHVIVQLRDYYKNRLRRLGIMNETALSNGLVYDIKIYHELHQETFVIERRKLIKMRDTGEIEDSLFRQLQSELDMEETNIRANSNFYHNS